MNDNFTKVDQQYGNGFKISDYGGKYSLESAQENKEGDVYTDWASPQGPGKQPKKKQDGNWLFIPVKVQLGHTLDEAINNVQIILSVLRSEKESGQQHPGPGSANQHGQNYYSEKGGNKPAPSDPNLDIPF